MSFVHNPIQKLFVYTTIIIRITRIVNKFKQNTGKKEQPAKASPCLHSTHRDRPSVYMGARSLCVQKPSVIQHRKIDFMILAFIKKIDFIFNIVVLFGGGKVFGIAAVDNMLNGVIALMQAAEIAVKFCRIVGGQFYPPAVQLVHLDKGAAVLVFSVDSGGNVDTFDKSLVHGAVVVETDSFYFYAVALFGRQFHLFPVLQKHLEFRNGHRLIELVALGVVIAEREQIVTLFLGLHALGHDHHAYHVRHAYYGLHNAESAFVAVGLAHKHNICL